MALLVLLSGSTVGVSGYRSTTPGGIEYSSGRGCGDIVEWVCLLVACWSLGVSTGLNGFGLMIMTY